jgi:hypothetical protein
MDDVRPSLVATHVVCCSDLWFDLVDGTSTLRMAVQRPDVPREFWSILTGGIAVRFRELAVIRGRRVFEAIEWRREDSPDPSVRAEPIQPEGPLREARI